MKFTEIFLTERERKLTARERALLKKDINAMSDEEKELRAKIDSDDWEENEGALADRYGKHDDVSDFEGDGNFSGNFKDKNYRLKRGMEVFVFRNLNVGSIDKRIHKDQIIWSIRANENVKGDEGYSDAKKGNVMHHAANVALTNAKFVVKEGTEAKYGRHSEIEWVDNGDGSVTSKFVKNKKADPGTGWRGVRSTGQKNIHAGVTGTIQSWGKVAFPDFKEIMSNDDWSIMTYDPYKFTEFQIVDKKTLGPGKKMEVLGDAKGAEMVMMGNMAAKVLGVIKTQRPLVIAKNVY